MGTPTNSNATTLKMGGTSTAFTQEATTKLTANTVYQITDSTKRIWDPAVALNVEVDPDGGGASPFATVNPSLYTVDYMFGTVTFASDQGASAVCRVSGNFIPTVAIIEAKETSLDDMNDLLETTVFGTSWKTRIQGMSDASGEFMTLAKLKTDNDPGAGVKILRDLLRAGTPVLLEYKPGGGTDIWRGWIYEQSGTEKKTDKALLEGSVKFTTLAPYGAGQFNAAIPNWGT
jgi:hypothetical protein